MWIFENFLIIRVVCRYTYLLYIYCMYTFHLTFIDKNIIMEYEKNIYTGIVLDDSSFSSISLPPPSLSPLSQNVFWPTTPGTTTYFGFLGRREKTNVGDPCLDRSVVQWQVRVFIFDIRYRQNVSSKYGLLVKRQHRSGETDTRVVPKSNFTRIWISIGRDLRAANRNFPPFEFGSGQTFYRVVCVCVCVDVYIKRICTVWRRKTEPHEISRLVNWPTIILQSYLQDTARK